MSILIIIEIDISYKLWSALGGNQHSTFGIWTLIIPGNINFVYKSGANYCRFSK